MCPVKCYEFYKSKLSDLSDRLWQQPRKSVSWEDDVWFGPDPQSKNKIGGLMTTLSKDAQLSKKYTNHCVRSTCITILDWAGFEARHIMSVSGHKKIETIQNYSTQTSENAKRSMSNSLASALLGEPKTKALKADPKTTDPVIEKNQEFTTIDQKSFRELLELTPKQERVVLREMFNDFEPTPVKVNNHNNTQVAYTRDIQNIVPRMIFQNSSITINFNITKVKIIAIYAKSSISMITCTCYKFTFVIIIAIAIAIARLISHHKVNITPRSRFLHVDHQLINICHISNQYTA